MNEENVFPMSEVPDLSPQPKVEAILKLPHKITIVIEDIDVDKNEMALDVKFDPEMKQNVPMTAALSMAQPVLELLKVMYDKKGNPDKKPAA